jgi:hypothetical protein
MNIDLRKLKIKIKHLALEPAIIRKEEQKVLNTARYYRKKQDGIAAKKHYENYFSLYHHRVNNVRDEARATQLAYAFCRGKEYLKVETPREDLPYHITRRVVQMVMKYHPERSNKFTDYDTTWKIIKEWSKLDNDK